MTQSIKSKSLDKVDVAIDRFNYNLKANKQMDAELKKGLELVDQDGGIRVFYSIRAHARHRPIFISFSSSATYNFDTRSFPTLRMAPTVFDVRDYFIKSLLKRPEKVNLGLNISTSSHEVLCVGYSISQGNSDLGLGLPEETNPITDRYRKSMDALVTRRDFLGAIDLGFRIYDEVTK